MRARGLRFAIMGLAALALGACFARQAEVPAQPQSASPLRAQHAEDPNAPSSILLTAGDIAYEGPGAEATAKLLDRIPGQVLTLGDTVYQDGKASEFQRYYEPTWGRHRARTRPVVGNHEYHQPGAAPYFDYFGAAAGPRDKGYYAYEVDPHWRVVVLNSNEQESGGVGPGSAQYEWLKAELAAHRDQNVIAAFHHPRWSSGAHGDQTHMDPMWKLLYMNGVDLALSGHDHHYERFVPMDGDGRQDDLNGIRSFIVGCGGKNHYTFFKFPHRTTAVRNANTFGVLKLSLRASSYEWEFVPEAGKSFTDAGRSLVH